MKITIDGNRCTGHGLCYMHAPSVIADDDQGYGTVIGAGVVDGQDAETARAAAANCPEQAISLAE